MAKYDVSCKKCNCTFKVQLFGPHKDREWRLENYTWLCKECQELEKKEKVERLLEEAAAEDLAALQGSEKQIAWALQIRAAFIASERKHAISYCFHELKRKAPSFYKVEESSQQIVNEAFAQAVNEPSAHWWIDNRNDLDMAIGLKMAGQILDILNPVEQKVEEEAKAEMVMLPETRRYDSICEIIKTKNDITIHFPEKVEEFRLMVRGAGFAWENKRWVATANLIGKAEFVAAKALQMGIAVIAPESVREAVKAGSVYERWVYLSKDRKYFYFHWWSGDWYKQCRSLPGSRWENPFVAVPVIYRDEVSDFAKINGFGLSTGAVKEINKSSGTEIINPVMKSGEEIEPMAGNGIAEGLKDD